MSYYVSYGYEFFFRGIIKVLLVWLEHFPDHFRKDPNFKLLRQIQTFVTNELTGKIGQELFKKTQQIIDRAITPSDTTGEQFNCFNLIALA